MMSAVSTGRRYDERGVVRVPLTLCAREEVGSRGAADDGGWDRQVDSVAHSQWGALALGQLLHYHHHHHH